jgi:hypothetical protein
MRLSSSWWRIVKLSSWVLINSQSPSVPVEEEDDKRPENECAVALRKGRLVEWIGMDRRGLPRGDMDGGTSQLVLFHVKRHLCVMCCLIRRFTFLFFASFRALLATELGPETWTSGCPLWLFFLDDACMTFSRNLVSISPRCTDIVLLMCRLLDAGRS